MKHVVEDQVVAVLVFRQVLNKLGPVPPDCLHCLEHVNLSMLDDLLDARISRAVNTTSSDPVLADHDDRAVVRPLPPPLHHVHQLHQRVGRGGHLVSLRPAHELEQLTRLARSLNPRHQLCKRHDLLVDFENPRPDVGIVVVRHILHCEHLPVLLGLLILGPEGGVGIADPGGGVAEDHHGGAVVVIHQGPEVAAGARHRPLGHNVLAGMGVTINKNRINVVRAVVPLEGSDVGPEVVRGYDEHVPVLVPVVSAVARGAVPDGEARGLVADQRILQGVRVLFQLLVFNRFFFYLVCELTDRESGVDSAAIFFQSVINKLVLVLKICLDINLVINKLVLVLKISLDINLVKNKLVLVLKICMKIFKILAWS